MKTSIVLVMLTVSRLTRAEPAPQPLVEITAASLGKEETLKQEVFDYHYDSFQLADPFVRDGNYQRSPGGAGNEANSLKGFPLADYSLVGTWTAKDGLRKALILTPSEEGVIVKVGDSIGDRQGTVITIKDDSLMVRQNITTSAGVGIFEDFQFLINND